MKMSGFTVAVSIVIIFTTYTVFAQKVGFINSDTIREKFPEAQQAQQIVQSLTDVWKSELDSMQQKVDSLEVEIKKNKLIWTETERKNKEEELGMLKKAREEYAKTIFEPNGKYDHAVDSIFTPIEEKINTSIEK